MAVMANDRFVPATQPVSAAFDADGLSIDQRIGDKFAGILDDPSKGGP